MKVSVYTPYKIKYSRELSRLLLVHLPPWKNRCYGLTGNFLPVIIKVRSNRKFSKLKGWYFTEYSATNVYAKLTERMKLLPVDNNLITRLWYRLKTVDIENVVLKEADIDNDRVHQYVTVVSPNLGKIFLFYLNDDKKWLMRALEKDVYAKPFYFKRFGRLIINYVSDDVRIVSLFIGVRA